MSDAHEVLQYEDIMGLQRGSPNFRVPQNIDLRFGVRARGVLGPILASLSKVSGSYEVLGIRLQV